MTETPMNIPPDDDEFGSFIDDLRRELSEAVEAVEAAAPPLDAESAVDFESMFFDPRRGILSIVDVAGRLIATR